MRLKRLFPFLSLLFGSIVANATLTIEWLPRSDEAGGARGTVQLTSGEILATRTEWSPAELKTICSVSRDDGKSWKDLATIVRERRPADIGDGHLLQLPTGEILYSYRHHVYGSSDSDLKNYSIRVAISRDRGETWEPHSTVATSSLDPADSPDALRGLWSSFLLLKKDGTLHCVFDDEDTPHRKGFIRHQWLTMKTWDYQTETWENPVTVSRAHDESHLSRDGMPSVVELPDGRLLCAFESVQTKPPHANCIRFVTSADGGKIWSWEREERGLLFKSSRQPNSLAVSPWMIRLPGEELLCLFATDEDRTTPGISGTPPARLFLDIKSVISTDNGQTWSHPAAIVFDESHRNYLPGVLLLQDGTLLATFLNFDNRKHRAMSGKLLP